MKPRTDDTRILVSYPKSGRTWLRFALATAQIPLTFTHAGAATNRPLIGRPYDAIPSGMLGRADIFMHRNPIDTAVSMYYQVHHKDLRRGSGRWWRVAPRLLLGPGLPPGEIDRFVLHPVWGLEKVCRYNRMWLDHVARSENCLVLSYEDMRAAPAAGFQRILDHLGHHEITGAALAEASDFARMRAIESRGGKADPASPAIVGQSRASAQSAKVRRGKVQGYRDELSAETVARCLEIAARHGFDA